MLYNSSSFSAVSTCILTDQCFHFVVGHVCIGNLNEYLSFILQEIQENSKRQYLLLQSLKEVRVIVYSQCLVIIFLKHRGECDERPLGHTMIKQ